MSYKSKRLKRMNIEIDGNVFEFVFSNYAMSVLDEEFEEGSIGVLKQAKKKVMTTVTKIIYAGIKYSAEEQEIPISHRYVANSMFITGELANKIVDIMNSSIKSFESSKSNEGVKVNEEKNM